LEKHRRQAALFVAEMNRRGMAGFVDDRFHA
jgi:hypothetical protein